MPADALSRRVADQGAAQMTCGTVYGVVPFVSRRSNGVVCGLVSAGGAIGGVLWQAIFFLMVNTTGNSAPPKACACTVLA